MQINITMRYHYPPIRILKVKHNTYFNLKYLPKRRNMCPYKCLYMSTYGCFVYNSQTGNNAVEAIHGILLSNEKDEPLMHITMNKYQNNSTE